MLADNKAKGGPQRSLRAKGTHTCPLRGAILTRRSRKQDDDRDGQSVRQGASQDGVVGSGPPALCVKISLSLAEPFNRLSHMHHHATHEVVRSQPSTRTLHMQKAMLSIVTDLLRQVVPASEKSVAFHPEVS